MWVCGREFSGEVLGRIEATVRSEPELSRRELSRRVCQWLGWYGPDGRPKQMSCRVALLKLHRRGLITLPHARPAVPGRCRTVRARPALEPFAGLVTEMGLVEVIAVRDRRSRTARIWNALMESYHPLGAGPLCGAQIRYVVRNEHGFLAALSFSAASWRIAQRDQFIGWSDRARQANLPHVVCNSRFLIPPHVRIPNLASKVLSLCARRLPRDWQERYGQKPVLLETYVQTDRFTGASYRAANWKRIGSTGARTRNDHHHKVKAPIKDVYVYPLQDDFRDVLCHEPAPGSVPPPPEQRRKRPQPTDWAEEEFGAAELGDHRLERRLVTLARDFYARPLATLPEACGTRAKAKAAYRFFDHDEVTMERVLSPHYEATTARVAEHSVVLAVQDTTFLDYSTHPATVDLGPIGTQSQNGLIGLVVHDTMAYSLEGTPLGLLQIQCWARNPNEKGKRTRRYELPIEQKESYKWLRSFQAAREAQRRCPHTTVVSVGDREADLYELFELASRSADNPKLLVRAERKRLVQGEQGPLWDFVHSQHVAGIWKLHVPRRGNRPARTASLEIRFTTVELRPPKRKSRLGSVRLWAVEAREKDAPGGIQPIHWMLLTTLEVNSLQEATEKLEWYSLRWQIEVYHRTLKSGCRIEQRQLRDADRLEACLAIDAVVAWRIAHLTKLGRETPDVPCTVFFEEAQWQALAVFVTRNPTPPTTPPSLREATRMVATLGGFLGRKCDGQPGTKTIWIGLQRLDDFIIGWSLAKSAVSSHRTYGQR